MLATSCVCVCVRDCVCACCEMMSQDFIMTARHCGEWSPSLHLPHVKTAQFCLVARLESPLLDRQFRFPTAAHEKGHVARRLPALLFPFFLFVCLFVLQWSVRMQSSRPCQTEEDNLEGARGGTVPGMFIESFARRRQRNEGGRGQ